MIVIILQPDQWSIFYFQKCHSSYDQIQNFRQFETLQRPQNAVDFVQFIVEVSVPHKENAIETVITYDKGARWWPITGDQVKGWKRVKDGGKECSDDVCNLQIHNRFSMSKHVSIPKGPYETFVKF